MAMRKKKKCPMEFKKKLLIAIVVGTFFCIAASYVLSAFGMDPVSDIAVQMIVTCLGAVVGYLIATVTEKNSRNKYGIDKNGNPINKAADEEIGG